MNYNKKEAIEILERTPLSLDLFLSGLSPSWLQISEGEGTWTVSEVIEHLIEAEKYNWLPRLEHILTAGESKPFPPFDRYSHINKESERKIELSLLEFKEIRASNMAKLTAIPDLEEHFEKTGLHPEFGTVKVRELLSTWVVHDLTHIAQVVRVMAERYRMDVGPWREYLGIYKRK
ncbi:DinB family protein [Bacillus horti]|uniref:DinB-like domain-containing protein n=1 Tax=Caldalkalibacillus horti TaxID=77523 RepID=A0ABT9W1L0_9BACI|nr:DinB family protein [Bacillus horti]MDQ0167000.1 hypothetical protein [Bacillus horti]